MSPTLRRGELLLFDYRTLHRGLANRDVASRPVAYVVYAAQGCCDEHNFPSERLLPGAREARAV